MEILGSHVTMTAVERIEIGSLKGEENKLIIDREVSEKIHKAAVEALIVIGGPSAAVVLNTVLKNLKGDSRRLAEDHLRKSSRE